MRMLGGAFPGKARGGADLAAAGRPMGVGEGLGQGGSTKSSVLEILVE